MKFDNPGHYSRSLFRSLIQGNEFVNICLNRAAPNIRFPRPQSYSWRSKYSTIGFTPRERWNDGVLQPVKNTQQPALDYVLKLNLK